MVECELGSRIELVSGKPVANLIKEGITLYHICYEVDDIETTLQKLKQEGAVQVSEIVPAILFEGRKVVFIKNTFGLIELLEKKATLVRQPTKTNFLISLTANFSIEPIRKYLNSIFTEIGSNLSIEKTYYINRPHELFTNDSTADQLAHVNLLFIRLTDWYQFPEFDPKLFQNTIHEACNNIFILTKNARKKYRYPLFFIFCPSDDFYHDKQQHEFLGAAEAKLYKQLKTLNGVICVQSKETLKQYPYPSYFDEFSYQQGHIPYKQEFFASLALIVTKSLVSALTSTYKVIVVDCDNTL